MDWRRIYALYKNTYERKWGSPYLTAAFFTQMPVAVQHSLLAATARDDTGLIQAMSLSFESDTHLYGRYWGCAQPHDAVHFELCYYRLIQYAIESGKKVFEAGAQGEQKIKRGFVLNYDLTRPILLMTRVYIQPWHTFAKMKRIKKTALKILGQNGAI